MSEPKFTTVLPPLRRIVTVNNPEGLGVIQSDTLLDAKEMTVVEGGRGAPIWVTRDSLPTKDNNNSEDGGLRTIDPSENFGIVPTNGTNIQTTELPPGAITPMHRTSSLDHNILINGEVVLIMEDGTEKHLKNPGDTVVMKGSMHAWKNPSTTNWVRWITVLLDAEPAVLVGGEVLEPKMLPVNA